MTLLGINGLTTIKHWIQWIQYAQDVNRPFPNLIPTKVLVFSLYLSKFQNSLFTYLKGRNFCDHKLLRNKSLQNLFLWFGSKIAKIWSSKYSFGLVNREKKVPQNAVWKPIAKINPAFFFHKMPTSKKLIQQNTSFFMPQSQKY